MERMIWHNKIEFPDTEEGLFVYVFDDGVDVEEYEEDFFFASNLIKWAYWEDVLKAISFYENPKIKEIMGIKIETINDLMYLAKIKGFKNANEYIKFLKQGICKEEIEGLKQEIKELKEIILKLKGMLSVYRISGNVSTYTNFEILALLSEAEKITGENND